MGKRSAAGELFLGNMGSIQRERRPSMQREDQLTMETKLEQIAVKAVNQLPKSVVRCGKSARHVLWELGAGDRLRRPGGRSRKAPPYPDFTGPNIVSARRHQCVALNEIHWCSLPDGCPIFTAHLQNRQSKQKTAANANAHICPLWGGRAGRLGDRPRIFIRLYTESAI